MRLSTLLLALPLFAGCAAPPPPEPGVQADAIDCIDLSRVSSRIAEGSDRIRFDLLGGRAYENRLPGRCPGLEASRNFGALAFEVQGNRLCRGDKVRAVDPALGGYGSSVPCVLGHFTPVRPR
jgi:hypothetical protein